MTSIRLRPAKALATVLTTLLLAMAIATPAAAIILPTGTSTTWNPGIPGGIPNATTIYATLNSPGAGDATTLINNAISGAQAAYVASGKKTLQVVYLNAGNYFCSSWIQLRKDGVVLRGAGPDKTRIVSSMAGGPAIVIGDRSNYPSVINVTADAPKGTKTLTLSSTATIAVGDILQLDQIDSPKGVVTQVNGGTTSPHYLNGYVYFGDGIYFKRQTMASAGMDDSGPYQVGTPWSDGHGDWRQTANWNALNAGPFRSIMQQVEVAAKSGNTLTLSDPLHVDFTVARQSQVYKVVPLDTEAVDLGTRWVGVEDLAVAGGSNNNVVISNAAYSWIRRVESDGERIAGDPLHPGMVGMSVFLGHCYRCVVRDSYVHHATQVVNGGGAYGIVLAHGSSESLIENNIVIYLDKPILMQASGGGNVIAYNYVDNAIIEGTDWQENAIDDTHTAGSHMELIEGNWTPNLGGDTTHGSSHWMTHFRNFASGRNSGSYKSIRAVSNARAFGADAFSGWNNVVGNVLGSINGLPLVYEISGPGPSPPDSNSSFIWRLGGNGDGGQGGIWDNGMAKANLFRHGNWDAATGKISDWQPGYDQVLPNSFYLANKPAFFGSLTWPWVDPGGATRLSTLPAKARYDAGTPFAPPPGPALPAPTNLRVM